MAAESAPPSPSFQTCLIRFMCYDTIASSVTPAHVPGRPDQQHISAIDVEPTVVHPCFHVKWPLGLLGNKHSISLQDEVMLQGRAPLGLCIVVGTMLHPGQRIRTHEFNWRLAEPALVPDADETVFDITPLQSRITFSPNGGRMGSVAVYLTLDNTNKRTDPGMLTGCTKKLTHLIHVHPFGDEPKYMDQTNQDDVFAKVWQALSAVRAWIQTHMSERSEVYLLTSAPMALAVLLGAAFRPAAVMRSVRVIERGIPLGNSDVLHGSPFYFEIETHNVAQRIPRGGYGVEEVSA